jgi:hypothetical protein
MGYLRKLNRQIDKMKKQGKFDEPGVTHIMVIHEDECPALKGASCRCDPEIREGKPPGADEFLRKKAGLN